MVRWGWRSSAIPSTSRATGGFTDVVTDPISVSQTDRESDRASTVSRMMMMIMVVVVTIIMMMMGEDEREGKKRREKVNYA
jgi:uncharacterized membrane protein YidH (DUF202 family)